MPPAVKVRRLPDESDRAIQTVTVIPPVRIANPTPLPPFNHDIVTIVHSPTESHVATDPASSSSVPLPSPDISPPVEHAAAEYVVAINKSPSPVSPPSFKNPTESVWIRGDLYGPPDPVSNLPHIKFTAVPNETSMERRLREDRQSVHDWNHKFWTLHNTRFAAVR
ncbi:hypothetical protein RvY_00811-2 [Ramazzottius varieornatus]|uniref:Uncharacterized protein n=1 Tax=Ramazzottius varieornatus TaxID=947166 RepID=A0A1D1UEZ3_RAMVA|nr:hypothetical protein RvY_00811-2 [Ramazzottius varieornatus]